MLNPWRLGAAIVGLFVLLPFVTSREWTILAADALFLGVTGTVVVVSVMAARRQPAMRKAWLSAGFVGFCWLAAQVTMVPEHLGYGCDATVDAVSSVFSMLVVPGVVAALVSLAHAGQSQRCRRQMTLDAMLAIIAAAAVASQIVIGPIRGSGGGKQLLLAAIIAWEILSLVGLSAATIGIVWRAYASAPRVAGPMIAGTAALIVGMLVYAVGVVVASYYPGSPIDIPFLIGFLLLIVAARRAIASPDVHPRAIEGEYLRWRTWLVTTSVFAVGGLAAYAAAVPDRDLLSAVMVVVATLLLAARLGLGASDHIRLDRRTRERDRLAAVLELSAAVAGSLDPDQVMTRLAEAAARAGGRTEGRAVLLGPDGALEVTASVDARGTAAIKPADLLAERLVTAGASSGPRQIRWAQDAAVPAELSRRRLETGIVVSVVAPLAAMGERLGYVEAWTPGDATPFQPADLAAIAAIGQQGGLAMRNARLHSELERRARTDELTGLLNRGALFTALDSALSEGWERGGNVGLLLLDLDGFKACNDTLGHIAGDRLLRKLAGVLAASIREQDVAGRYGGDEFIVVLPGADAATAELVAGRIIDRAQQVAPIAAGGDGPLRISIGMAIAPDDGRTPDELIAAADRAMYAAKEAGRMRRKDFVAGR